MTQEEQQQQARDEAAQRDLRLAEALLASAPGVQIGQMVVGNYGTVLYRNEVPAPAGTEATIETTVEAAQPAAPPADTYTATLRVKIRQAAPWVDAYNAKRAWEAVRLACIREGWATDNCSSMRFARLVQEEGLVDDAEKLGQSMRKWTKAETYAEDVMEFLARQ